MKRAEIRSVPVLYRVRVLLPLFVLMTAALCVLADRNFKGLFSAGLFYSPYGLLLFVGIPFLLIAFSCILLYRLYGDIGNALRKGGVKRRIFFGILAAGLAAMIPPAALTTSFLASLSTAIRENVEGESVSAAADIAAAYYDQKITTVERVARDFMNPRTIQVYKNKPSDLWPQILAEDPSGICFQVFQVIGGNYDHQSMVFEVGDSHYFLERSPQTLFYTGLLPRSGDESDLIRYVSTCYLRDDLFICVYTSSFIPGYDRASERIASDYQRVVSQQKVSDSMEGLSLTVYAVCLLPALLLYILMAYIAGMMISSPVIAFHNYLRRVLSGDRSCRLFTDSRSIDGVSDTLRSAAAAIGIPAIPVSERFTLNDILVAVRERWQNARPQQALRLRFSQADWFIASPKDGTSQLVYKFLTTVSRWGTPNSAVSVNVHNIEKGTMLCCRIVACCLPDYAPSGSDLESASAELNDLRARAEALGGCVLADTAPKSGGPAVFLIDFPAITG